jgi:glycosyltransferase involved in cell wall biosynthesis
MRVWLLNVGEPLPIDPGKPRLHRTGLLAEALVARGAEVVWWTSTFRHTQKDKLFDETTPVTAGRLKLWCLNARPYMKNVSITRILTNREIADQFEQYAYSEPTPDVVVASYPIPDLAGAAARYAQNARIPSLVDVRDLWPDIWPNVLPPIMRPFAKFALWPFHLQAQRVLREFTHITGMTDDFVDWAVKKAGRQRRPSDCAFPFGYPSPDYSASDLEEAQKFWDKELGPAQEKLRICFFGYLGSPRNGIASAIGAVRALPEGIRNQIKVVICGAGAQLPVLREAAKDLPQIVLPGWIDGPRIQTLARSSHLGLLPYQNDPDFLKSIPNKVIEYLAHGLPVVTCLRGVVGNLIEQENCGFLYQEGDAANLARLFTTLLEHPEQIPEVSRNASRLFNARFRADEVYGSYADHLASMVDNGVHAAAPRHAGPE